MKRVLPGRPQWSQTGSVPQSMPNVRLPRFGWFDGAPVVERAADGGQVGAEATVVGGWDDTGVEIARQDAAASADGVRDTDEFFMRSIDQLVDALLLEKKIPHETLPRDQREAWVDVVRDRALALPALSGRLF